jgi:hypothetical protein
MDMPHRHIITYRAFGYNLQSCPKRINMAFFQTERKIALPTYINIQSVPRLLPTIQLSQLLPYLNMMPAVNAIKTPLDFIKFMDAQLRNNHPLSSVYQKHFSKIAQNPDAVEWAIEECNRRRQIDVYHLWANELASNANSIGLDVATLSKGASWLWLNSHNGFNNADLSSNCSDKAAKIIEFSFEFVSSHHRNNMFDVPTLCKNPNPSVVRVIEDYYFSKQFNDDKLSFTFYNPMDTSIKVEDKSMVINLASLAANPSATEFVLNCFLDYFTSVDPIYEGLWSGLTINPHPTAINFLIKHWTRVDLSIIAMNPNRDALDLMQSLVPNHKLWKWGYLSANPAAVHLLKMHPSQISYGQLSRNPHQWSLRHLANVFTSSQRMVSIVNMLECCYRKPYYHDWVDFDSDVEPISKPLALPRIRRPSHSGSQRKRGEKKQTRIQTRRIVA